MNTARGYLSLLLVFSFNAEGETASFPSVWNQVSGNSATLAASRLQKEATAAGEGRTHRHWLPKVSIDAKTYQTNDPGASFFGLMSQRSLRQSDFVPDSINRPDSRLFTRGALGIDLPLYEGGGKVAEVSLYKHSVAAQDLATSQAVIDQYAATGKAYASIAILEQQKARLLDLHAEISRMIKNYELGRRSNPAGYSGLLGMKSLSNRLTGLIHQYEAQRRSHHSALKEMGVTAVNWTPEPVGSVEFIRRHFAAADLLNSTSASFSSEAAGEAVKAREQVVNMEKGRFRPRVGAFAEAFVFNGDRDTADGYNAGIYLQWALYDPSNHGRLTEAKLNAMAAAKSHEAADQHERATKAALVEGIAALRQNIDLLNDSYKLLTEQAKMTGTLFRNGSISALQLVEVLNRRADLIVQQSEVELGLVSSASQYITTEKFDIAKQLNTGVSK